MTAATDTPLDNREEMWMDAKPTAASGPLLPLSEYELPLLSALVDRGGTAPVGEVIDKVGETLDSQLTDGDRTLVPAGYVVWKMRTHVARMNLIKAGAMARECSDGTWAITEQGRARV